MSNHLIIDLESGTVLDAGHCVIVDLRTLNAEDSQVIYTLEADSDIIDVGQRNGKPVLNADDNLSDVEKLASVFEAPVSKQSIIDSGLKFVLLYEQPKLFGGTSWGAEIQSKSGRVIAEVEHDDEDDYFTYQFKSPFDFARFEELAYNVFPDSDQPLDALVNWLDVRDQIPTGRK